MKTTPFSMMSFPILTVTLEGYQDLLSKTKAQIVELEFSLNQSEPSVFLLAERKKKSILISELICELSTFLPEGYGAF
jgi:hypothetical protein